MRMGLQNPAPEVSTKPGALHSRFGASGKPGPIHSAPPGCSEHHTGRAVDIGTPHCKVLDEEFEQTEAFDWLVRFAGKFGFRLSYPRGNSCGYAYEPWHWCFVRDFPSRPGETSAG